MLEENNEEMQEEQRAVIPFSFSYDPSNEVSIDTLTIEPLYPAMFEYSLEEVYQPSKSLAQLCEDRIALSIDAIPNNALIKEHARTEASNGLKLQKGQVKELLLKVAQIQPPHLLYLFLPKFPYTVVKDFSKEPTMLTYLTGEAQRQIETYVENIESSLQAVRPVAPAPSDNMKPLIQFFSWTPAQSSAPHGVPCRAPSPSRTRSKSPSPKSVSPRSASPKPTRISPSTSPKISNSPFVVRFHLQPLTNIESGPVTLLRTLD